MVLKAALAKYQPLVGTMPNEALKEEISNDEKEFLPEEVDEIYQELIAKPLPAANEPEKSIEGESANQLGNVESKNAGEDNGDGNVISNSNDSNITNPGDNKAPEVSNDKKAGAYIVAVEFRDINNFSKCYRKGQDVSHLPKERLEKLVTLKHVVIV